MILFSDNNYLKPDIRWELWGCKTYEDYLEKFLVKGRFHNDVDEDVIKEYETVENLLAHSYFYYPMFDEAFSKVTRIFEMAVKIRCKQLQINFSESQFTPLRKFLKELEKHDYKGLSEEWGKVITIRNYYAHPERHSYIGPINLFYGFQQIINIINRLFLQSIDLHNQESLNNEILVIADSYNYGLFVLEKEGKRYLVYSAIPYRHIEKHGHLISFWVFRPILQEFAQTMEDYKLTNPICLHLTDAEITANEVNAKDLKTGKGIRLIKTTNKKDEEAFTNFIAMRKSSSKEVQDILMLLTDDYIFKKIVQFEYEYFWY